MTNNEFIEYLVTRAQITHTMYGIFPSVTIAQAIWESGWGKSYLATTDFNLFGIKFAGAHDSSLVITSGTLPTDGDMQGTYCHYLSWNDSIQDHGYFLKNNSIYTNAGVFSATTPFQQISAMKSAGYAEDVNYVTEIMNVITDNNLTQYDTSLPPVEPTGNVKLKNNYLYGCTDNLFGRKFTSKNKTFELVKYLGDMAIIKDENTILTVPRKNIINI